MVIFAFNGTELIGVTAGEAKNPEKTIPAAINKVFWRICIFYIGSLMVIYVIPAKVFTYFASIAIFGAMFTWAIIVVSQMRFRKGLTPDEVKKLKFPMIAYPYTNYISLAFLAFAAIVMCFTPDTSIAMIIGPMWLAVLTICYYAFGINKKNSAAAKNQI